MSDFNTILHQQCNIELQTNCKISVKYVDNYNSYSGFSAGAQKNEESNIGNGTVKLVAEEISNNSPA